MFKKIRSRKNCSPIFPQYDTDRIENDECNYSSISPCLFVAAVTFLESLHSNDGRIHKQPQRLVGGICEVGRRVCLMCHDIHTLTSFTRIGSGIQKSTGRYTNTQHGELTRLPTFFPTKESRLITLKYAIWLRTYCYVSEIKDRKTKWE